MSERSAADNDQPRFAQLSHIERHEVLRALKSGATRRELLSWLAAAGIGAVAGQAIFFSASSAMAATPKTGGALRVAVNSVGSTETLDPAKYNYAADVARGLSFFNGLTRISSSNEAVPELAESYERSSDGNEWIFRLRKGVEFHDGKTLSSSDVVYSLLRHKDAANASVVKILMDQVVSVTADGPEIVRVRTVAPNGDIPVVLGTPHFVIVKDGTTDFLKAVGTGPYRLEKAFVPGSRTIGTKFSNYFKEGRPYFDELHVFAITDTVARTNALFSGDADAVVNVSASSLDQIASNPDLQILNTQTGSFSQLLMMVDRKPTNDPDLRLAVKYLLDRERFLKTVQRGYGQIGNDHVVPPSHPLYNHDLPQRTLDFDKADFHLRKAGLKGARLELPVSEAVPGGIEFAQIFQQSAARAGLTIDVKREPVDGYWANTYMKKPFIASRWKARPTLDMLLSLGWISGAKWNDSNLSDVSFDKLVVEARSEIDQAKRKELYGDIQKYLYDNGGNGIFAFINFTDGLSGKLKGIEPNPTAELGGFYLADTAWFDS